MKLGENLYNLHITSTITSRLLFPIGGVVAGDILLGSKDGSGVSYHQHVYYVVCFILH